jgi:5'-3' exoribonuclease 2
MNDPTPEFTFAEMTAAPVNDPNAQISNSDLVANRAALRMANISAAAALKAELSGTPTAGAKRKAEDDLEQEVEEEEDKEKTEKNEEEEANKMDTTEDKPLETIEDRVTAGKAIMDKVAADKKAKEDAAREREPNDDVRLWENGWKERYYGTKFKLTLQERDEISQ